MLLYRKNIFKKVQKVNKDKAQEMVNEATVRCEKMRNAPPPKFPLWLLCKLIWISIFGKKQVDRIQLAPPYRITYKDDIAGKE